MLGPVALWVSAVQLLAAGLVVGVCVLQWVWWRSEHRPSGSVWALVWSADISLMLLLGSLAPALLDGPAGGVVVAVHTALVAGFLVLAIPTTQAFARGRHARWWVLGALLPLAAGVVAAGLRPSLRDSELLALALVCSAAVVIAYVAITLGRLRVTGWIAILVVAGLESLAMLAGSGIVPDRSVASVLVALWAIPIAFGLAALALLRVRQAQEIARRQHSMRDAAARLTNAAWFASDADRLLERARDEARLVTGDPSIEGSLRPISNGRFVTELFPTSGTAPDAQARAFLVDLGQVVSTAAERYALTNRLRQTAFADPLTGLPNRRAVDQHLREILERANVERTRVALVYCDLDGFKRFNDLHGHEGGDAVLVRVADHLRAATRGTESFVGRLGGDEFVVIVPRAPQDEDLAAFARVLRDGFIDRSVGSRAARLSVGVAAWVPGAVVDPDTLMRHADTAMLEAKANRSGYRLYDDALRRRVEAARQQRAALEAAVAEGRFRAVYQPIVDARTLEVVQVEALARWDDGDDLHLPASWLDLAEESGLIVPISCAMLAQARRALERFQVPVAVNLSARHLSEPDVLEQIESAWGGAFWEHLTIEITESALVQTAAAVPVLSELRARGAKIAVDDFGTGYSSLARLARLPVDVLKIDRSFVRDIDTDRGRSVIRTILELAASHGLDVVAEGVERASDLSALVEQGVRRAQGNFLGRPAPTLPVRGPRPGSTWSDDPRPLRAVPTPVSGADDRAVVYRHA